MSDKQRPSRVDQTGRNIDLAFQLLDDVIADDEAFDEIPDGGTLVLLPYDDVKLTLQNLAMAHRVAITGKTVYLRRVGAPPASIHGLYARQTSPSLLRWSAPSGLTSQPSIEYDPIADAEVFDFSGGRRSTFRLPVSTGIALLVDFDRQEAVGYSVPEALVAHLRTLPREDIRDTDPRDHDLRVEGPAAIAALINDLALVA